MEVLKNFLWKFAERMGAKIVGLIVSLALARILDTEAYGTIAIVAVIISVLQVFVDSGLGVSLVQKLNADDLDFSTVFYFNVFTSLILYAALFLAAPLIAAFYKMPELTALIRVLSVEIVISSVKNVQQAYVARTMQFKRFFFATLGGTIGAAILGIYMAVRGFGVWALVAQHIFNSAVDTLILWLTVKWRPKRMFSLDRLKGLFRFGWKILGVSLLNTISENVRTLVIGKIYTKDDLAYYDRGIQIPQLVVYNINTSLTSVLLPVMSRKQEHLDDIKDITRLTIRISTYFLMPMMVGLAVCAEPLVQLVLTEKWLPCVPYIQVFCANFAFYSVTISHYSAYKATGRSDLYLKVEFAAISFGLLVLLVSARLSVFSIAIGLLIAKAFHLICTLVVSKRAISYTYMEQVKDLLPNAMISLCMGAAVYGITYFGFRGYTLLIIQILTGIISYMLFSIITNNSSFHYTLALVAEKKGRGN